MGGGVSAPVLLLDVDGVLNALPYTQSDLAVWGDWQHGSAVAEGSRWPITWSPSVVTRLREWHEGARGGGARQPGRAVTEGSRWPITWSPSVVTRLREWHEAGQAEVRWLTTWGH